MSKKSKKELPFIGGAPGPKSMPRIEAIQIGDELAGGKVKCIFWYRKHKCFIICQHSKYWDIHHYRSDTKKTREFKGKTYADNLYTYKTLSRAEYDLKDILYKLVSIIKI